MTNKRPAEIFPPGIFLKEEMDARNWTQTDLAEILGKSTRLVNEIINVKRSVTPETAKVLSKAFGTSAMYWLNLETAWQLFQLDEGEETVERRAKLYDKFSVKEVIRRGWVPASESIDVLEKNFLDFYEIKSMDETPRLSASFRRSNQDEEVNSVQLAWLYGAKKLTKNLVVNKFIPKNINNLVGELDNLKHSAEEIRKIPRLLSEYGIRFVIVEPFHGSKIDGVCFWLNAQSPVIAMTLRLDKIDNFWFTLIHELRHVANRDGIDSPIVDIDLTQNIITETDAIEIKANEEAAEFLISKESMDDFIARVAPLYSREKVYGFARRLNVHPGIVVGRLQYLKEIPHANLNNFIEKVRTLITPNAITDGYGYSAVN